MARQFLVCNFSSIILKSSILELVNQYPQEFDASIPFYSIGIHPWYIKEDRIDEDLRIIEEKFQ